MNKTIYNLLEKSTLIVLILILFSANQIFSQEKEAKTKIDTLVYEINDVIVTGTRTDEKILDIPYSVFRVDKKELSFGKKISAKDVLADVPGLFLQNMFGSHDLRISIRGFGTRSNTGVRGVRILQDGIPISEPDGETSLDAIDFTSLGGVEVVKGNLSSLYANAPGGVINFISDLYFPKSYVASMNQVGKFGYRQNGIKVGLRNVNNRLLFSYYYRNFDGYRQHSSEYQHLLNAVYEGYLGSKSTITILGNYSNGFTRQPGPLTWDQFSSNPFQADPLAVSLDYRRITQKGRAGVRFKTTWGDKDYNELSLTGYGNIKELQKADNQFYNYTTRYSLGSLIKYVNRTQLFDRKNVLTAGMDYAYQAGPINNFDNVYGNQGISVQNEYNESLSNVGFYFLNHFNIIPEKMDLFLSGRLDRDIFYRNIYIPYGYTDTSRVFQFFTPKIGLNYKLTSSIAVYTNYGLSFDIPALTEIANTPLTSNIKYTINPDLNAQKSYNFEFGIKGNLVNRESEFMRKLFFEATFFNYKIKDEIVPFIINQTVYYRNAAKTNRMGVEIGVKSEPFEEIELTVNYTYTHFKYDSYPATVYTPSGSIHEDYSGNMVPSVPTHIVNFILNYEYEISDEISGLLQWDCDLISKMYVNDQNTASAPGYFYGNVMAGINFSFDQYSIIAYLGSNNIFDKRYIGFINTNDFYGKYYETGEPRNFFAGFNFSYHL